MRRLRRGRRQARRTVEDTDASEALAATPAGLSPEDTWAQNSTPLEVESLDFEENGPEREFEPFVPVESAGFRQYGAEDDLPAPVEPDRRRWRLPGIALPRLGLHRGRPRLGVEINGSILMSVVVLVGGGIFGTLLVQGDLRESVETWWPAAVIAGAVVWMLLALLRRRVASFLSASAFVGVGMSALLDTQSIASADDTVMGIVLVAVGLGIAIRGFLLRQQSSY